MKMDLHIVIENSKMFNAMEKVEESMCNEWFNGNKEAYQEWAGDRITDALWDFLQKLEEYCHIGIENCDDKFFDMVVDNH